VAHGVGPEFKPQYCKKKMVLPSIRMEKVILTPHLPSYLEFQYQLN
jgi:hypothetical protein